MNFAFLKQVVEKNDTRYGRILDLFIQFLILVSLVGFSVETLPDLTPSTRAILSLIETFCVVIFTIEYLLRISVADQKLKFIFSFYGLIDLIAILPFYIASGIDLRAVRMFRMFRVFRAFKLFRFSSAIERFRQAFNLIKAELILFFVATMFVIYLAAVGIYYFENVAQPELFKSVFHSLWWAVTTLTTVGYGEIYPITVGGKLFTFVILMVGLGIVAVPSGLLAAAMNKVNEEENLKTQKNRKGDQDL